MFFKHGNGGVGGLKDFVRKLYANIYKCELNCEMTSSFLAKKHHAQKIGHLMLDGGEGKYMYSALLE